MRNFFSLSFSLHRKAVKLKLFLHQEKNYDFQLELDAVFSVDDDDDEQRLTQSLRQRPARNSQIQVREWCVTRDSLSLSLSNICTHAR